MKKILRWIVITVLAIIGTPFYLLLFGWYHSANILIDVFGWEDK